ncbi:CASP-like protein 5A1 isoform X3 [Vitis vinifera]|uniref:CASP-like protein 5A1 isoform X3 n=2 Tax=Vitis vinifera TaxID=29760 RepID=UPI0028834836|nr:CASP-like protein 5A1 isoform X3 [Vitis vinifera]
MFVSRPVVHPVEAPPLREGGNNAPRVRMKDVQGMAGTPGGLVLRLFQFLSAVVSLCVMVTISDFYSVTAFCYLVVAVSLQSLWSLSLAIMDIYALLVRRSLRNSGIISVFTVGDGVRVFKWSIQAKIACLWLSWTCSSNLVKQQETNLCLQI